MTITQFPGRGAYWPIIQPGIAWPPAMAVTLLDAEAERVTNFGRVVWSDGGTHDIDDIGFLVATVTAGTGSTFVVSLRDMDLANGPPPRDDGSVDQSYTTTTMPTSNTWNKVALDAARADVAHGTLLAVVFEITVFGASTAINVSRWANMDGRVATNADGVSAFLAAAWAAAQGTPNIALFSDDGAVGTLGPYWLAGSSTLNEAFNSGSTGDERGNEFTVDAPMEINGLWAMCGPEDNTANFDIILYTGDTATATVSFDAHASIGASRTFTSAPISPVTLTPGTTYRIMVKPTTAQDSSLVVFTYGEESMRQSFCGTNCAYTARTNGGSFDAPTTTKAAGVGMVISGIDDGAGGSTPSWTIALV